MANGKNGNGKTGRPSKLDDVIKARILRSVELGLSMEDASIDAGLHRQTVGEWKKRGEQPDAPKEFQHFAEELQQAKIRGKRRAIESIGNNLQNPQVSFKYLAIRYPDEWSEARTCNLNIKGDIKTEVSGELDIKFRELISENPEVRRAWAEKMKKAIVAEEKEHETEPRMYD